MAYNPNSYFNYEAGRGSIYSSPPKSKPKNANQQAAKSMGSAGIGGLGGKPTTTAAKKIQDNFRRETQKDSGSTYDEIALPTEAEVDKGIKKGLGSPDKSDDDKDQSPIERIKSTLDSVSEMMGLGKPEKPKRAAYTPDKIYSTAAFRARSNDPIDLDAQNRRINAAVDFGNRAPMAYLPVGGTYDEITKQRGADERSQQKMAESINATIEQLYAANDPARQFYQSGVPMEQRLFAPEIGYDEIALPSEATVDKKIKGLGARPEVTVTELDATVGGMDDGPLKDLGLMTSTKPQPVDAVTAATTEKTNFVNTFVERMGSTDEGREDHTDSLGITTLGYGVLPATARSLGYDPDSEEYQDREKLAKVVYNDMYDNARAAYPKVFNNVTMDQAQGVLSMYINLGQIPNSVKTALSRDDPDFDAAKEGLALNILGSPRNDDGSRKVVDGKVVYTSNKGLSKRRAREYNTLMEGDSDYTPIADVEVRGNRARPTFVWVTEDGTEVHSYTPELNNDEVLYQGLDSSNSMRTVRVE